MSFAPHGINFIKAESVTDDGWIDRSKFAFIDKQTHEALRRSQIEPGDLLLSMAGVYLGKVAVVPPDVVPANTNQALAIIRLNKDNADPKFVAYYLRNREFNAYINSLVAQSAQPNLNLSEIGNLPLRLPPMAVQRAIAHILGTLDDKIELNRKMNETLEVIARAIFTSWFVDFDPVRAKAEGRDPGLPKRLADLFPDSFDDSKLGEIPGGWSVNAIGDLAAVKGGSTPSTKEPTFWEGGFHCWATPKDLSGLRTPVLLATERLITDAGLAQISSGLLPAGTVLLSSRAPIGYLAISEVPVAVNQGFIAMQPFEGVSNLFLLFWAEWAHDEIVSRANGSTFLEISKASFRPIPVVVPRPSIMQAFDHVIRPLYSHVVLNERESQILSSVRDSLLPRLISGELRITDTDRILKRST
jgi:type I restriction enzyme S subunit